MKTEFELPNITAVKKVYATMTNADLTEGIGQQYALCICESRSTAYRVGKKRCAQGSNCRVMEVDAFYDPNVGWFTPGTYICSPTEADIKEDKARAEKVEKAKFNKCLIEKLKENKPLNESELKIILKNLEKED
jgi:hypothetical protein